MSSRSLRKRSQRMYRYLTYIIIFLSGFLIDVISKRYANKAIDQPFSIMFFEFRTLHNKGGAFGFLKRKRKLLYLLGIISFILGIILFAIERDHVFRMLLSAMLSGAAGNTYERIRSGQVTDFFRIRYKSMPYTNIADMLLFIPVLLILTYYMFTVTNG